MTVRELANLIDNHNMVAVFQFNDYVRIEMSSHTVSWNGLDMDNLNFALVNNAVKDWYDYTFKTNRSIIDAYYYLAHLIFPRRYHSDMESIMKYFIKCYPYNSKHNIVRFTTNGQYKFREFKGQIAEEAMRRATKFGVLKKWYKDEQVAREYIEVLYPIHKMYNKEKEIMPKQMKKIQPQKLVNIIDKRSGQTWRIPRWKAEDIVERFPNWFSYTTKSKHKYKKKHSYTLMHIKTGKLFTVPKDKALQTLSTHPTNTKFRLADGLQFEAKQFTKGYKTVIDKKTGKEIKKPIFEIKPVLKKRLRPKMRKNNFPTDRLKKGRLQKITYLGERKILLDTYKEKGDFIDDKWFDNNFPKYKGLDYEVIDWTRRNSKGEVEYFSRLFAIKPVKKTKWVYRHAYRNSIAKPGVNVKKKYPKPKTSTELVKVPKKVTVVNKIHKHLESVTDYEFFTFKRLPKKQTA